MAPCQDLLEAYRNHASNESLAAARDIIAEAMKWFQGVDKKELLMSIPNV